MNFLEKISRRNLKTDTAPFRAGDTVRVNFRIVEGDKERTQQFEGVCIRKKKGLVNSTFTVRKYSSGVGVERTFPMHSPRLESIEVVRKGKVRQGRLFYLRNLKGKAARIQTLAGRKAGELGIDDSGMVTEDIEVADVAPADDEK